MSDLAHELRTPLAAIDATVEALADGVIPADERALGALTGNAQRLLRLVEDLALVSRAQERSFRLALADVDLADLARQAIASSSALMAAKGIDVIGPTGPGPVVRVDPDRLVEVLGGSARQRPQCMRSGGLHFRERRGARGHRAPHGPRFRGGFRSRRCGSAVPAHLPTDVGALAAREVVGSVLPSR